MSAYQRTKGHAFEREVARRLREAMKLEAHECRRGLQYRDGGDAPDVVNPLFAVECKCGANPPLWRAMEQAQQCASHLMPVAVLKRDRVPPVAAMLLDDWLEIVSAYFALTKR